MNEKNRNTLQDAISQLREYTPPKDMWQEIEKNMAMEDKESVLQDAIDRLPSYKPPSSVWKEISRDLEKEEQKEAKRISIRKWSRWAAAAASIAACVLVFNWFSQPTENVMISYSTEKVDESLLFNDWDSDEKVILGVIKEFADNAFAKSSPEYQQIWSEWEELNTAKSEIKEMIEVYGVDPNSIHELSSIEKARNEVVKRMASLI